MFVQVIRMAEQDDLYYIEQVKSGNVAAFSYLVERHQNFVYSMALKMLKNVEDAEEMAQDCFVKAYTKLDSFESKSKFSTWLYSIVYYACVTELRKKKKVFASLEESRITDKDEYRLFESLTENKKAEQEKYLNIAFEKLPEEDNVLLNLYYYEGLSISDISDITGLSESNVKIKTFRARKKVYAVLHELLKDEIYSLL